MQNPNQSSVSQAVLAALAGWPKRRDRLPEDRADLMAAAWWSGVRNVRKLAATADVARGTVYDDLRARGVDPTNRNVDDDDDRPHYSPLQWEIVEDLAQLMSALLLPATLTGNPGPLVEAAWQTSIAFVRIADLLKPDGDRTLTYTRAVDAEDLTDKFGNAMKYAQRHRAAIQTRAELGARVTERAVTVCDAEALIDKATVSVCLPNGQRITVELSETPYREPEEGFTVVSTDSKLLDTAINGVDHLAIRAALDAIAEVLTLRLAAEAFEEQP